MTPGKRAIRVPSSLLSRTPSCRNAWTSRSASLDRNPVVRWLYWKRLDILIAEANVVRSKNALEIGCGRGVLLPSLSQVGEVIWAIDNDTSAARMVAVEYSIDNIHLVEEDFLENTLPGGQFDLVVAASVFEHFANQKLLFERIKSLCSTGGRLLFVSPTESFFYQVGRKLFGYKKPPDHFYGAAAIARFGESHFDIVKRVSVPRWIPGFLAPYHLYVMRPKD